MLNRLNAAWALRRVLVIGGEDAMTQYACALLHALGARETTLPPDADVQTLSRALCEGRTGAVIVPVAKTLASGDDPIQALRATSQLLSEMREAGVPLAIFASDADVYAESPCCADERTIVGGKTREGLTQTLVQLYADGVSRGLLGDPVPTIIVRHAPCLGCEHPATSQNRGWCRALLRGEAPTIAHPDAQGTFLHPLDVLLGALSLGARHLLGSPCAGIYTFGTPPQNLCANRSAWLRLCAQEGGERAFRTAYPPCSPACTPLDGTHMWKICGYRPQLNAVEALAFLLALERANVIGADAVQMERIRQTDALLTGKISSHRREAMKGV